MAKLLSLITICFIIGLSLADRHSSPWYYTVFRPFITPTSICAVNTTREAYLSRTLTLINTFQINATYNSVLQRQSPNFVAYIKNSTNQGLLRSNCSAFITGVKTAKSADENVQRAQQLISRDIEQRIQQIPHDVTGSNAPNELDSGEQRGGHRH